MGLWGMGRLGVGVGRRELPLGLHIPSVLIKTICRTLVPHKTNDLFMVLAIKGFWMSSSIETKPR